MKLAISYLNTRGIKTLASCCGHWKYPKTIIVEHNTNNQPIDIFSLIFIPRKNKFYKKDNEGFYYIPEVLNSELREKLSELEHIQWEHWSKTLSKELEEINKLIGLGKNSEAQHKILERLMIWKANWKPYSKLDDKTKEYDRIWADKCLFLIK